MSVKSQTESREAYIKKLENQNKSLRNTLAAEREKIEFGARSSLISYYILNDIFTKFEVKARNFYEKYCESIGNNPLNGDRFEVDSEDTPIDLALCLMGQSYWGLVDQFMPTFDFNEDQLTEIEDEAMKAIKSVDIFKYTMVKNTLIRVWKGFSVPAKDDTPSQPVERIRKLFVDVLGTTNVSKLIKFCKAMKYSDVEYDCSRYHRDWM